MSGNIASEQLRGFVERIERLEEEKATLVEDIRSVKSEAKAMGFDTKMIGEILRLRRMDSLERAEFEALREIYMAALGMLHDTPLSDGARRRLRGLPVSPDEEQPDIEDAIPAPDPEPAPPETTIGEARGMGHGAALDGTLVTMNPFPAGDKRRAAWDEGWCAAAGSDGMDIPAAWRRSKKKDEKPDGDGDDQ